LERIIRLDPMLLNPLITNRNRRALGDEWQRPSAPREINEIAQIVEPDEAQRAALEVLKTAMAKAVDLLKAGCPTDLPSTPTGRIEVMRVRLSAMLEAVRTVRAPLAKFYALLNDEQRARFNAVPSSEDQNEPERRRNLSVLCSERASGISSVPRRMELAVRPDEVQRASLRALQDAMAQAGELLKTNCPTYRPITPVVRIDAMEQRLDAMLRAINIVESASIGSRRCRDDLSRVRYKCALGRAMVRTITGRRSYAPSAKRYSIAMF
jgi:hypothetical protein